MSNELLFFIMVISAAGSVLYWLWNRFPCRSAQARQLRYVLLHLLVGIHPLLLAAALQTEKYLTRKGSVNWLMESPTVLWIVAVLAALWGIGAAATLIWCAVQHIRDWRRYRMRMKAPASACQAAVQTAAKMGVSGRVRVWQVYGLETPELGGWLRPDIYLPVEEYTEEQLVNIITHELTHYRYGDRWFRELALLTLCLYWFNPITWRMVRQLKSWDEYHCDYRVCCCEHIDRGSYIRLIGQMFLNVRRQRLLNPCFAEEGCDLRRRMEYMDQYEKKNEKRWVAALMSGIAMFLLLGSGTALAAGAALNGAQNRLAIQTAVGYEEPRQERELEYMEEYIMSAEEAAAAEVQVIQASGMMRGSTGIIEVSINNTRYESEEFTVSKGDTVAIRIYADPGTVTLKVGLMQPNGTLRYVTGSDEVEHDFKIETGGTYRVFVWNETSTSVKVTGVYNVK